MPPFLRQEIVLNKETTNNSLRFSIKEFYFLIMEISDNITKNSIFFGDMYKNFMIKTVHWYARNKPWGFSLYIPFVQGEP